MSLHSIHMNKFFAAVIPLLLMSAGCSFSDSSGSISDMTSSIVSSPSSISDNEEKYSNAVSDYTMAYVKSSHVESDYGNFLKGLSDIAEKRGISNWDQESSTYIAIGKGLREAGVEGISYETYKKNFAGGNEEKMRDIQRGYDSK